MSFFFRRGNRSNKSVNSINSTSDDEEEVSTPPPSDLNESLVMSSSRLRSSSLQQPKNKEETFEIIVEGDDSEILSSLDINRVEQSSGLLEVPKSAYKRKISFSDELEKSPNNSSENLLTPSLGNKGNYKVTPNSGKRILTKIPSSLRLDPKTFARKNSTPQLFTSPRNPLSLPLSKLNDPKITSDNISNVVLSSRSSSQLVVIIEIGRKYFKCGISGEYCPRVVIPISFELSEMMCKCKNFDFNVNHMKESFSNFEKEIGSCNIETDVIFDEYTQLGFYGNRFEDDAYFEERLSLQLEKLLKRIFIDELKIHMDNIDHLVILESIHSVHENLVRRTVEDICNRKQFSKLKGIKFINSQCCALISSSCSVSNSRKPNESKSLAPPIVPILSLNNRKSNEELDIHGLVIDCGYSECKIVPVLFGGIVQAGVEIVDIGSKHILRRLKDNLMKMNSKEALTPPNCGNIDLNKLFYEQDEDEFEKYVKLMDRESMLLEDLLTRVCYCDGEGDSPLIPYSDVIQYWNGKSCISITDPIRREACDLLFEPLVEAIVSSLRRIEIEQRSKILKNLLICGGLAEIVGFKKKLLRKLRDTLCEKDFSRSWLKSIGINMDETISPSILNWYGASIISSQL